MLVFDNRGDVPLEAFTTFGMSAKPGTTNPIGQFGTGLKYAVAVTLRLGGTFRLWRGTEEYEFYTRTQDFRGKVFEKVRMKRRRGLAPWRYEALPFTTELGKHWAPWMAVRELEANCRDEAGVSYVVTDDELRPTEGRTLIVVDCEQLQMAFAELETIFLPEHRVPIYEDFRVKIYPGESDHIFFRGMRVTDLEKRSLFTYEMKSVFLTEDRTSKYPFSDDVSITNSLRECADPGIIGRLVAEAEGHHEENFSWDARHNNVAAPWYSALSHSNVSGRFAAMRDNLELGISPDDDVSVTLEVRKWEVVMALLKDAGSPIYDEVHTSLVDGGWKP